MLIAITSTFGYTFFVSYTSLALIHVHHEVNKVRDKLMYLLAI